MRAADRFHVPPWELMAAGGAWRAIALATVNAEAQAGNELAEQRARKARMDALKARMRGGSL